MASSLVEVNRGGDVTWHGPGQLVGYPIMRLPRNARPPRLDVHGYLRRLEQLLVRTLADFDIQAGPRAGRTGVWVDTAQGERKLAAIGVRVTARAVTLARLRAQRPQRPRLVRGHRALRHLTSMASAAWPR